MNYKEFFKGDYIIAEELADKAPTLTIADVRKVRLESAGMDDEGAKKQERDRGVVYFLNKDRGWVLNRTNAECLAAMWGAETEAWRGKRVTLFAAQVRLGGKMVLGIRVKGSPDLDRTLVATIALPRRRPIKMELVPTGKPAAAQQREREPGDEG